MFSRIVLMIVCEGTQTYRECLVFVSSAFAAAQKHRLVHMRSTCALCTWPCFVNQDMCVVYLALLCSSGQCSSAQCASAHVHFVVRLVVFIGTVLISTCACWVCLLCSSAQASSAHVPTRRLCERQIEHEQDSAHQLMCLSEDWQKAAASAMRYQQQQHHHQ